MTNDITLFQKPKPLEFLTKGSKPSFDTSLFLYQAENTLKQANADTIYAERRHSVFRDGCTYVSLNHALQNLSAAKNKVYDIKKNYK